MLKNDVIKRLDELQGCEMVEFDLGNSIKRVVHLNYIQNYPDAEMLKLDMNNFKTLYCSIVSIHPFS
jgi:hypothetical protein